MPRKGAVWGLLVAAAIAQPRGTGVIAGLVLDGDGHPLRKVVLTLTPRAKPASWATAMTDASGRFAFDSLPAGKYQLVARREGFGSAVYGGESERGAYLPLADGERRIDIVLTLTQPAVISGTVLDNDGDPLPRARVFVLAEHYPRGKRELMSRLSTATDDRGEYRISNAPPGRYYLAAESEGSGYFFDGEAAEGAPREKLVRQYYGGATDWRRAAPLTIRSGEQVEGIDFRLPAVRAGHIRGQVTGVPEQAAARPEALLTPIHVGLMPRDGFNVIAGGRGASPPEYRFDFPTVGPGTYDLVAYLHLEKRDYWARRTLDVAGDLDDVALELAPAVDLKGRVTLEGDPPQKTDRFRVSLTPAEHRMVRRALSVTAGPDGRFTIEQVPPGIWDINVSPVPSGGYLKSMRLGMQDVLTEDMEIGPHTDLPLNIVISTRGAKIEGELEGEAARAKPITILLAPAGRFRHVASFFAMTSTGPDAKFELSGITPGEYRIFAIDGPMSDELKNPDFVERNAELGELLKIAEGDRLNVKPKIIGAGEFQGTLP